MTRSLLRFRCSRCKNPIKQRRWARFGSKRHLCKRCSDLFTFDLHGRIATPHRAARIRDAIEQGNISSLYDGVGDAKIR